MSDRLFFMALHIALVVGLGWQLAIYDWLGSTEIAVSIALIVVNGGCAYGQYRLYRHERTVTS